MEKVTDKWFKEHGWTKYQDFYEEEDGTVRRGLVYSLTNGQLRARWDRVIYNYSKKKWSSKKVSRYYMFYASGCNGFSVENRISYQNFTPETIIAALKVCGYDEFGNKLDK